MIRCYRFRQVEIEQNRICKAEARRKKEGHANSPTAKNAADCWSKNKAQTKCGPQEAHAFGAILSGSDICDIRWSRGDVSARNSIQDAAKEEQPQGVGKTKYQETNTRANYRNQQHGPAAMLV